MKVKLALGSLLLVSVATSASAMPLNYYMGVNALYSQVQSNNFKASVTPIPNTVTLGLKKFNLKQKQLGASFDAGLVVPLPRKATLHIGGELAWLANFDGNFKSLIQYPGDIPPVVNSFDVQARVMTGLLKIAPYIQLTPKVDIFASAGLGASFIGARGDFKVQGFNTDKQEDSQTAFAWQLGAGATYQLPRHWSARLGAYYTDLGNINFGKAYFKNPPITNGFDLSKSRLTAYTAELGLSYAFDSASAKTAKSS